MRRVLMLLAMLAVFAVLGIAALQDAFVDEPWEGCMLLPCEITFSHEPLEPVP